MYIKSNLTNLNKFSISIKFKCNLYGFQKILVEFHCTMSCRHWAHSDLPELSPQPQSHLHCTKVRLLWPTPTPFIEAWTGPSLGSFAHRQDKWRINKLLFGPFCNTKTSLQILVKPASGPDWTGLDKARRGATKWNCERSLCPLAVDFLVVFL